VFYRILLAAREPSVVVEVEPSSDGLSESNNAGANHVTGEGEKEVLLCCPVLSKVSLLRFRPCYSVSWN